MGSHAVLAQLSFPSDVPFDSASFRDELAFLLDVPVDRVRIVVNAELGSDRFVDVAITDLTQDQETDVSAFFDDDPTFTLDGFGTVRTDFSQEVAKPRGIVTLEIPNVCTSVSATNFPQTDYNEAFDNALASTASVTTSIDSIDGDSPFCANATPAGSTRVETRIAVPAADLGAVLALLPAASSTIDLGGDFGEVSLGNTLLFQ